jgi:hypothetical protein
MPVSIPVTPSSMNYASVVFCAFAAISATWYFTYAKTHFKGPGSMDINATEVPNVVTTGTESDDSQRPEKLGAPYGSDGNGTTTGDVGKLA